MAPPPIPQVLLDYLLKTRQSLLCFCRSFLVEPAEASPQSGTGALASPPLVLESDEPLSPSGLELHPPVEAPEPEPVLTPDSILSLSTPPSGTMH